MHGVLERLPALPAWLRAAISTWAISSSGSIDSGLMSRAFSARSRASSRSPDSIAASASLPVWTERSGW